MDACQTWIWHDTVDSFTVSMHSLNGRQFAMSWTINSTNIFDGRKCKHVLPPGLGTNTDKNTKTFKKSLILTWKIVLNYIEKQLGVEYGILNCLSVSYTIHVLFADGRIVVSVNFIYFEQILYPALVVNCTSQFLLPELPALLMVTIGGHVSYITHWNSDIRLTV